MPLQIKKVELQLKDGSDFVDGDLLFNAQAQAWATGSRGGTTVISDEDQVYHNNAKWWSEQAETYANNAASVVLTGNLAPEYNNANTYAIGDYVMQGGGLYECNTEISTPEQWNAQHWTSAKIGPEVTNLKNVVNSSILLSENFDYTDIELKSYLILINGKWQPFERAKSSIIEIPSTVKSIIVEGNNTGCVVAFLKSDTYEEGEKANFSDGYSERIMLAENQTQTFLMNSTTRYFYFSRVTTDGTVNDEIITFIKTRQFLEIDDTFSDSNKSANAKLTGDIFFNMSEDVSFRNFTWEYGYSIIDNGNSITNTALSRTKIFPVVPGECFINLSEETGRDNNEINTRLALYNDDVFVERTHQFEKGEKYFIPENVNGVRILFSYTTASGMTLGVADHKSYFKYKIYKNPLPNSKPNYVAFGASTTTGAVHRFTGQGTITTQYPYPNYIADVLGLNCINLGVGTTGFLCRNGSDNNIMDLIYNHDAELQDAKLVTIVFGYGNDETPIPSNNTIFPIGTYTDYYPYDEEGYHPSGSEGIATMLDKGATMMGCINWCIKWINTHYPKAQLILILGSPSLNKIRTITQQAQSESYGTAPYKLTFANPYATGKSKQRFYNLSEQFNKLLSALGLCGYNMITQGNPITHYSALARDESEKFAIFSTTGNASAEPETWEWNSHPNNDGYNLYGRFIAGIVTSMYSNKY